MKVENDVLASVPDNDKERALLLLQFGLAVGRRRRERGSYLDAVADEVGNAFISCLQVSRGGTDDRNGITYTTFLTILKLRSGIRDPVGRKCRAANFFFPLSWPWLTRTINYRRHEQ